MILQRLDHTACDEAVAVRIVMQPKCPNEVASLFVWEKRPRGWVLLKVGKQVDDVQPQFSGERKHAVVIRTIALANHQGQIRQIHEVQ
jgi:hypothetical protein